MDKNFISLNIRYLRKEKKMNQSEVGKVVGKSAQVVSKYEKGEIEPSLKIIYTIADFFDVSVGDLLTTDLSEGYDKQEKPEKDLSEMMPLVQALKESQEKYKKLEAEIRKHKDLAKKFGLE